MGLIKVTNPTPPADDRTTASVNRMKLKELDNAKILKAAEEVKILPFTNRKQTGKTTITFLPIVELVSSVTQDRPLRSGRHAMGSRVDYQSSRCRVPTLRLEWLDEENPCRRSQAEHTDRQSLKVTLMTIEPSSSL